MPITWILSFGSIISALSLVAVVAFWRWWATRWREPDEITKITIGVVISAFAPLLLVAASMLIAATKQKAGLGWALAFETVNDIGFSNILPVGLALYSRAAPKGFIGIAMGIYFLQYFLANLFVGKVGGLLDTMPASTFWLMHSGLIFGAAAILLVVRYAVGKILAPDYAEPAHGEA
jgi:POT family proton-dependent oligopeptide transporter